MTSTCPTCGAVVADRDRHRQWHLQYEEVAADVKALALAAARTIVDLRANSECGATKATVIGCCGRDAGHDGDHRSTGATFAASWVNADAPADPR